MHVRVCAHNQQGRRAGQGWRLAAKWARFALRMLEPLTLVHERDMKRTSKRISKRQKINGPDILAPRKCVCECVYPPHPPLPPTHTLLWRVQCTTGTHAHKYAFPGACASGLIQCIHEHIHSGLISLCLDMHKHTHTYLTQDTHIQGQGSPHTMTGAYTHSVAPMLLDGH